MLPTAARPLRLAEFGDLFAATVQSVQRMSPHRLRLTLRGGANLDALVSDLVGREAECCSFFTFTTTSADPGQVTLDVAVPAAYVDVLDGLAHHAELVRGKR